MTIRDEFTDLPLSKQRKWQLRQAKAHRCTECGRPAEAGGRCLRHMVKSRESMRRSTGAVRRYDSLSYRITKARE